MDQGPALAEAFAVDAVGGEKWRLREGYVSEGPSESSVNIELAAGDPGKHRKSHVTSNTEHVEDSPRIYNFMIFHDISCM